MEETLTPLPQAEHSTSEDKDGFDVLLEDKEATINFPIGSDVSSATKLMGIVHEQIKNPDVNLIRFDLSGTRSIDRAIFGQLTQAWLKAKSEREKGQDKNIVFRGVNSPQIRKFFDELNLDEEFAFEDNPKGGN